MRILLSEKSTSGFSISCRHSTEWDQKASEKSGIVNFTIAGLHPHDLTHVLDNQGVAIRAGHHCAMPLHQRLGVPASARASFYLYNTAEDVQALATAVNKAISLFC